MQTNKNTLDLLDAADTPVVCIIYNRCRFVRNLINTLRPIKPRRILVVADGPISNNSEDHQACELARAEVERIDWECTIERDYADSNLGCSRRIVSGLDWAFSLVDRALILEDDIDAHPEFFYWATHMLDAYEDRDDVAMVSGHNPLVRWPQVLQNSAGIPSRRGGIWGWGTWRHTWHAVQKISIVGAARLSEYDVASCDFEPSLGALYTHYLESARKVPNLSWDCDWTLRMAMSGRVAIISPINLIHNLGVGADATHTKDGDDLVLCPARPLALADFATERLLSPTTLSLLPAGTDDRAFDRARVLIELLVMTRDPNMAKRLARHPHLPLDDVTKLHLLPFLHHKETLHWIDHIASVAVDSMTVKHWRHALADSHDPSAQESK
ncbi:hypothetical protein MCEGE14_01619 [Burkholderiaceae bacterium]